MLVALIVSVAVAVVCAAKWRMSYVALREANRYVAWAKNLVQAEFESQKQVDAAIRQVWHHVKPTTCDEQDAARVLSGIVPGLPREV